MIDVYLPIGLLGLGLGYQLQRLRRDPGNPVVRCLAVMFGAMLIAVAMGRTWPYLTFGQLTGVPNAARLVQHVSAMAGFCAVQILLLFVARPAEQARRGVRPRVAALAGVVAVMVVLFGLAPVDVEAPGDFVDRYGGAPWVGPYLLLYLGYLGVGVVDVIRSCHRHARNSGDRPWLRASFRMLVLAGCVGLAYVISKAAFTIVAWRGIEPHLPIAENAASRALVGAGAICAAVAVLLPAVGSRMDTGRDWLRQWRLHRSLRPLWLAVCEAVPRVVLRPLAVPVATPSRWTGRWRSIRLDLAELRDNKWDLRWVLYRRLVEIQDGLLDLRFYRDPEAAGIAAECAVRAGLSEERVRAVVEAADIAAAVRGKQDGARPAGADDSPPLSAGDVDLPSWLGRVARAFARSPQVAMTLDRLDDVRAGRQPDRSS